MVLICYALAWEIHFNVLNLHTHTTEVVLAGWRGGAPQHVLPGSPSRPGKEVVLAGGEEVPRSTCSRCRRVGPEEIPEEVALAGWREVVLQRVLPVWSRG